MNQIPPVSGVSSVRNEKTYVVEGYVLPCTQLLDLARITIFDRHPQLNEGMFARNEVSEMLVYCLHGSVNLHFGDGEMWQFTEGMSAHVPKGQDYYWELPPESTEVELIVISSPRWEKDQHVYVK